MVELVLWSLVVALFTFALWLARRRPRGWEPGERFGRLRAAARGEAVAGPLGLGARVGPADLATDSPRFRELLTRRLGRDRVVWFEPPAIIVPGIGVEVLPAPRVADPAPGSTPGSLAARLRELARRVFRVPAWLGGEPEGPREAAHGAGETALEALVDGRDRRFVLAAKAEALPVLRLLHDLPWLRDHCRAVLLVEPALADDRPWIDAEFTHRAFDMDLARTLPFFVLRGEGAVGQVLRTPDADPSVPAVIEVIDLGAHSPDWLADPATGRALAGVLAALAG